MNCEGVGCKKNAQLICSIHFIKLCAKHYGQHCISCNNTPIRFDPLKAIQGGQINRLNNKVAQLKKQIAEISNQLVLKIRDSLKKSFYCLDQQKALLMDIIKIGKPEDQFNAFLENIPSKISGIQNSIQCLVDLEENLGMDVFRNKIKELEDKFKATEVLPLKSTVNPVLETLEKLDLKGKIGWCKEQNFKMIDLDYNIREIKITQTASFVFICIH